MSLPSTYKQAAFKAQGEGLTIEEVPLKLPSKGELLVKVEACGVCYSDIYAQHNGLHGGFPIVPGHEIIGRVAAVGDGVDGWKLGDRVGSGWHGGQDGTCQACKQGWYQMCDAPIVNGGNKDGGYAEYCLIRAEAAARVPANVDSAKFAPLLCAGVTVFNSIRHMGLQPGDTVAIQGLGGLGHLGIQYARRMGYRVIAISRGPEKEAAARELGAHEYIDSSKGDIGEQLKALGGAQLAITFASKPEAITPLLTGLNVLGKLLILSVPGVLPVDTYTMLKKGISVQAWPSGHSRDSEDAMVFANLNDINCVIEKFPLADAQKAYDAMLSGNVRFRAVITMD